MACKIPAHAIRLYECPIIRPCLSAVFAAKKSAEIAPGVGTATDIHLVFRNSIERLDEAVAAKAAELYQQYSDQQKANGAHYVELLRQFVATQKTKSSRQSRSF